MTVVTDIKKLKEDQQHSLRSARKIKEKADKEDRKPTASEYEQINGHLDEVEELQKEITTLERMEGIDPNQRLLNDGVDDSSADDSDDNDTVPQARRNGSGAREDREDREDDDGIDPYNLRWDGRESTRGFRDMSVVQQRAYLLQARTRDYNSAFYQYLRRRSYTAAHVTELERIRTLVEGVDADGGYLAPTQLVAGIIREAQEYEQLKPRMEVIRANARSLTYTKGTDSIVMGWVAELGTKPEDQPTFERMVLVPHVGAVVIWVSDELLEDESFGLQGYLQRLVGEAKVLLEEEAFISGSGSGRPFGILTRLNGLAGTPQRYTTGLGVFERDDIIEIPFELTPRHRQRAAWILGTNVLRTVALVRDDSGGAGTGGYLWQPSLQAGQPNMLNGYPVIESDAVALNVPIATGADVGIFGDLRQYRVFERLGLQVKRLEELRALTDEVGFRFRFRTGGDVMLNEAFQTIRIG